MATREDAPANPVVDCVTRLRSGEDTVLAEVASEIFAADMSSTTLVTCPPSWQLCVPLYSHSLYCCQKVLCKTQDACLSDGTFRCDIMCR